MEMSGGRAPENDPILTNPNGYFLAKYGQVEVTYGKFPAAPLTTVFETEVNMRGIERVEQDAPEKRIVKYLGMLRAVGALDAGDQELAMAYLEPED